MDKKRNVPEIRFAGFTDDWEQRKLGDILSESRIYGSNGKNANKLTVRLWGKGVVAKDDLLQGSEATQYFIRKAGQFIYGKLDFLNQAFGIIPDKLDGYESTLDAPAFDIDTNVNGKFLLEYISRENFYLHYGNLANGSRKAKRVHTNVVLDMPFIAPSFEEQTSIGNFFKQLDETIALHQRQTEKYQKLKIGFLESVFCTNLPPNNSKKTNAWEQRKLGEIAEKIDRKAPENSTAPVMMISASSGFINQSEKYSTNNAGSSLSKYTLLKAGELSYNHGYSKLRNFGSCFVLKVPEARIPFVYHSFSLPKDDPQFFSIYLNSGIFDKELKKLVSSSARMDGLLNISYDQYMSLDILRPPLLEQTAIGNFLKQLDETIALHQRELEKYKKIKQSYLEKMFI